MDVFILALVIGGGLLLISLFGGDGADGDVSGDLDTDTSWSKILSMRAVVYFLFGFGAVGTVLSRSTGGSGISLYAQAVLVGVVVAGVSEAVFRFMGKTESGQMATDQSLVGLKAAVSVPFVGGAGKVRVEYRGQVVEYLARAEAGTDHSVAAGWSEVVIRSVDAGTAVVEAAV